MTYVADMAVYATSALLTISPLIAKRNTKVMHGQGNSECFMPILEIWRWAQHRHVQQVKGTVYTAKAVTSASPATSPLIVKGNMNPTSSSATAPLHSYHQHPHFPRHSQLWVRPNPPFLIQLTQHWQAQGASHLHEPQCEVLVWKCHPSTCGFYHKQTSGNSTIPPSQSNYVPQVSMAIFPCTR